MFSNVVVGLKPGLPSEPLVELALNVCQVETRLHLASFITVANEQDPRDELDVVQSQLGHIAGALEDRALSVTFEVRVIAAGAAGELLKIASEREADLIVTGLARRSRVGKALMGSDAQAILMGAECAVLTRMLEH